MSRFGPFPDPSALLDHDEAANAFATMLDGGASDEQVGEFLVALSDRGETMADIAAAAEALRARLIHINAPPGPTDVCGTGAAGHPTLNIPTAAPISLAPSQLPVPKHRNRAPHH